MVLKLNKWGNSLGLRIPSNLASRYKLVDGIAVELEPTEGGILIKPVSQQLDLDYLLAGLDEDSQHPDYYND